MTIPAHEQVVFDERRAVARAICKSRSCEGEACCQWPANRGRLAKDCPVERGGYDNAAAAVITKLQGLWA